MRKLFTYLSDYKKESIIAPLFKMLEALFDLFVPLVVAGIINNGILKGDRTYIVRMCLVLILFAVVGMACAILAQYFAAKAAVGFSAKLRGALFAHIQKLSFTELDTLGTSALMNRMTSDVNQLQNGVNMALRLLLRSPFIVFGAMILAFFVNKKAACVFVVFIPVLSVSVFGIILATMPMYKKVQERLDHVLRITRENLTGVRVIRAFHTEKDETKRFHQANHELAEQQTAVGKISALMNPLTFVTINLGVIALLSIGGDKVDTGSMKQGDVVALLDYMSQILVELVKLANTIILLSKAFASAKRVQAVLDVPSSMQFPTQTAGERMQGPTVEFAHVDFTYAGAGDQSLSDIDFSVEEGQTVGVIGGTGSGKSTLVHLLTRFYDATDGQIRLFGKDIRSYGEEELRHMVGIVLQKAVLLHGTIRANLQWGDPFASDEEIWKMLEIAQAKEIVEKKTDGLDEIVEQGGRNLSGGQKQRLAIARTLLMKPKILILDDSSSALDYATDAALRNAIRKLEHAPTTFVVSQRTASLQHADVILVLDEGKLVGKGTHDELLNNCPVYREIYESQNA